MLTHILAVLSGTIFVLGIIAGVGPQNLFIISHAIKKNHTWTVAMTCCFADLTLLLLGAIGLTFSGSSTVILIINIIGILFMLWYLYEKIKGLFRHRKKLQFEDVPQTRSQVIVKALALTWLNPLVFIDMIVVVGGTATHYSGMAWTHFMLGAVLGDLIWVFGVTAIARSFADKLNRVGVWVALDIMTIIIMFAILYKTLGYVI